MAALARCGQGSAELRYRTRRDGDAYPVGKQTGEATMRQRGKKAGRQRKKRRRGHRCLLSDEKISLALQAEQAAVAHVKLRAESLWEAEEARWSR